MEQLSSTQPLVLVFDSGVGGLSILHEIQKMVPAAGYIYASDNEAFPYGEKDQATLLNRVERVVSQLINSYQPDIFVVACNTASTLALGKIREIVTIPVVGVVPAIKTAAQISQSGVIGLLATNATVRRPYTHDLIAQFARDCQVIRVGSNELVQAAEDKLRGRTVDERIVKAVIAKLFQANKGELLDAVVLGCTHFPLLVDELKAASPRTIAWVDSGEPIARRVQHLIAAPDFACRATATRRRQAMAVFTKESPEVLELADALRGFQLDSIEFIKI